MELLNGQCEIDFSKWYNKTYNERQRQAVGWYCWDTNNTTVFEPYKYFPIEFMVGVYTKFFDEKGLEAIVTCYKYETYKQWLWKGEEGTSGKTFKTRPEAQSDMFKQLSKQYNEAINALNAFSLFDFKGILKNKENNESRS